MLIEIPDSAIGKEVLRHAAAAKKATTRDDRLRALQALFVKGNFCSTEIESVTIK